ncbi:PaaD-like zinc ribbon domain-containing protein [Calidifontibacillus oryziterrae]|uniref:PaaD-like zinc ribbon domain-containing protein n=1 Tax=Calidifontibacillus oryziterrae TaxID=1191699 RepID=UPI0003010A4A|nr:transposase [Calidifontibacillus oryziterrae]
MFVKEGGKKPHCPFCDSEKATFLSPFGTAQLVRQYYCNDCKSVFEYIRWRESSELKHSNA